MHHGDAPSLYPDIAAPEYDFPTRDGLIRERLNALDPDRYARSRNFINGGVSYLSPYLSRGYLSTREVVEKVLEKTSFEKAYKLIQELAWRDYFQQVYRAEGEQIFKDMKQAQADVRTHKMIEGVLQAHTGIEAIDNAIEKLVDQGYMHNHLRMYTAMLSCNIAGAHWWLPSLWMYHHLLDHDLASNMLNWQWVAGSFSNKKYVANQENINKYTGSKQVNTYLDTSYGQLYHAELPGEMMATVDFYEKMELPATEMLPETAENIFVYNSYNLDPHWHSGETGLRIFHLNPALYKRFSVSEKVLNFMLKLAKENIEGMVVFNGSFAQLQKQFPEAKIYYKEHPSNYEYAGVEEPRDFIAPEVTGYYPSFFSYWKRVEKLLRKRYA